MLTSSPYLLWVRRVQGSFAHVFLALVSPLPSPSSILPVLLDGARVSLEVFVRPRTEVHYCLWSYHPEHIWCCLILEATQCEACLALGWESLRFVTLNLFPTSGIPVLQAQKSGLLVLKGTLVVIRPSFLLQQPASDGRMAGCPSPGEVAGAIFGPPSGYSESKSLLSSEIWKIVNYFKRTKMQKIMWHPCPTMCIYQMLMLYLLWKSL